MSFIVKNPKQNFSIVQPKNSQPGRLLTNLDHIISQQKENARFDNEAVNFPNAVGGGSRLEEYTVKNKKIKILSTSFEKAVHEAFDILNMKSNQNISKKRINFILLNDKIHANITGVRNNIGGINMDKIYINNIIYQ